MEVKESGYELTWNEKKTRLLRHKSVLLKGISNGAPLLVLGKAHEPAEDPRGGQKKKTERMITNVELVCVGSELTKPAWRSSVSQVDWLEGTLDTSGRLPALHHKNQTYRLPADEKLSAYSLEAMKPEELAGAKVIVRANARKVTIERDGKRLEITRLYVLEVHLLELNAEHAKVFQSEWIERKKATDPPKKP
jgi:hypothetical protein